MKTTTRIRRTLAAVSLAVILPLTAAACSTDDTNTSSSSSSTTQSNNGGGPGSSVDVSSVSTEADLIALIQDAYGDGGLGLHRGHEPVQDVLNEVLTISHDELHVRMEEQGQNLAAVAEDIGVDPQTLIDALVESRSSAIDTLVEDGTITEAEGKEYLAALEEAFTFRVTWDGSAETPTFSGLEA